MARASFKLSTVFVGCPYLPDDRYKKFRAALERVPLEFHYADSSIRTQYVLDRIRRGILKTDYSLFDITNWNANVTLEVGLAEGLNKDYYILFQPGRGKKDEPPADLKGVQRFQFKKLDGFSDDCLTYQINHHLVRRLTHPRNIYDSLSGKYKEKKFIVAMRILAHFKGQSVLHRTEAMSYMSGSFLRDNALDELIVLLHDRSLIKGRIDGQKWKSARHLFKKVTF